MFNTTNCIQFFWNNLKHFFVLAVIVSLGALFITSSLIPQDARAVTFNDAADGPWNVGTTWGGACASACTAGIDYPSTGDTAVIDSNDVSATELININRLNITGTGSLSLNGSNLNVYLVLMMDGGTFGGGSGQVSVPDLILSGGNFVAPATMHVYNQSSSSSWTSAATDWSSNQSTLILHGDAGRFWTVPADDYYNLTFAHDSSMDEYWSLGSGEISVEGDLSLGDCMCEFSSQASSLAVGGDFSMGSDWMADFGTTAATFEGNYQAQSEVTMDATFSATDSDNVIDAGPGGFGHLVFDGSGGQWALNNGLSVISGLEVRSGSTLDLNGWPLAMMNASGTFSNAGTIKFKGTENAPANLTLNTDAGTIIYGGDSARTGLAFGNEYFNLSFEGTGTKTLAAPLVVNGDLTISAGTLDVSPDNYGITLFGDWINNGTFNAQAGRVDLAGTSQAISGSTTFHDLSKAALSADTLSFQAGDTQTVAGNLVLTGVSGGLLSLRSSSSGSAWRIDSQGTRSLAYLDVQDSSSLNAQAMDCSNTGCSDSGGNTGWLFSETSSGGSEPPPPVVVETPSTPAAEPESRSTYGYRALEPITLDQVYTKVLYLLDQLRLMLLKI